MRFQVRSINFVFVKSVALAPAASLVIVIQANCQKKRQPIEMTVQQRHPIESWGILIRLQSDGKSVEWIVWIFDVEGNTKWDFQSRDTGS